MSLWKAKKVIRVGLIAKMDVGNYLTIMPNDVE
jgi:hypothetical protein